MYAEWFVDTFPNAVFKKSKTGKCIVQTINGIQGRRDVDRSWYLLLKDIFEDFGLQPCLNEASLFVRYEGIETLFVVTLTGDCIKRVGAMHTFI